MIFALEHIYMWLIFLIMLCVNYLIFSFKYMRKWEFLVVLMGYICIVAVILWGISFAESISISSVFTALGVNMWITLCVGIYALFTCFILILVIQRKKEQKYLYILVGIILCLFVVNVGYYGADMIEVL